MKNKRGQITIFVITSLVIVILVILFFALRYSLYQDTTISQDINAPNQYISECVSNHVNEASKIILQNGGYISKSDYKNSKEFEYEEVPYLCYTDDFYLRCKTQEPVLISHLNEEIHNYMDEKIDECFDAFKEDLISDGFDITLDQEKSFIVELMTRKVRVKITKNLEFEKAGEKKLFSKITSSTVSPLYDMALTVQRITEEESKYCNSNYVKMMRGNIELEIDKFQTGNDNKIYTITDTKTDSIWRFAVRGCVLSTPA